MVYTTKEGINIMNKLKWEKKFETGDQVIDSQHKTLFEMIDNLLISIYEKKENNEIFDSEKFLQSYMSPL